MPLYKKSKYILTGVYSWLETWGQSYNTFYTLGLCKRECLNRQFHLKEKCNLMNMLGFRILILWPKKIFELQYHFHHLGCTCIFVLRCKNLYRIGPRISWCFQCLIGLPIERIFCQNVKKTEKKRQTDGRK